MTKWFDTNYHYLVPEFSVDQHFHLGWDQLFDEVKEALDLGHTVKPVVIGPLTYLWLGKAKGGDFDKLELLDRLLPLYGQIFQRLADLGVEWVQIDEPILVLDLPQAWKNAFERAYNLIMKEKEKLLSFSTPLKFIFSHSALKELTDGVFLVEVLIGGIRHALGLVQAMGLPGQATFQRPSQDAVAFLEEPCRQRAVTLFFGDGQGERHQVQAPFHRLVDVAGWPVCGCLRSPT